MFRLDRQRARFVSRLAWRDIREEAGISVIVVIMLSFSFINLVFFPGFIDGLGHAFTETMIEGQTGHVAIKPDDERLDNADDLQEMVSRLEEVRIAEKVLEVKVNASYEGDSTNAVLRGTDAHSFPGYTERTFKGEFLNGDKNGVAVGRFLTNEKSVIKVDGIGIERGRKIDLESKRFDREFKVKGITGTKGGIGRLSETIFIRYKKLEEMTGLRDQADYIKIILKDGESSEEFKERLQQLNVKGNIQTWREQSNLAKAIDSTFSIVTVILSIVGIIVAVAAVGVVIFINASKRTREMGIIRAIGAQKKTVLQIFLLEALIFGLLGALLGNALALGIDSYMASKPINAPIGEISTELSPGLLGTRTALMLVSSVVAGWIPARNLSKTEIVETIENR